MLKLSLLTGIGVQDCHDELLSARRDFLVCWKLVSVVPDTLVDGVDVFGLEGGFADEKGVSVRVSCESIRAFLLSMTLTELRQQTRHPPRSYVRLPGQTVLQERCNSASRISSCID